VSERGDEVTALHLFTKAAALGHPAAAQTRDQRRTPR
jgi:hypothetical protein